jgi:preprotein translocase subunit SecG
MFYFLLVLLILDGLLLAAAVLLQAGQGGGLASLGGGTADKVLGGRQATTLLHRVSWTCGAGLLIISLILTFVSANRSAGVSEVQRQLRTTPQPVPTAPLGTEAPTTGQSAPVPAPVTQPPPAPPQP